ncbi:hypothetical protein H6G65_03680 [Microcystis elabens FACHB-917]|nr:hypothetical protein [Microcystis elabens FACHB-917]
MTSPPPIEPLEALTLPADAIDLSVAPPGVSAAAVATADGERHRRGLALAALRQAMAERQLNLPLGPEHDPQDPFRLLSLNRFAVQLAITGIAGDRVEVATGLWQQAATAPQFLLAAAVDPENDVVHFPGVLTAQEVVAAARGLPATTGALQLELERFQGGIDRLLSLVQLLDPDALPRRALAPAAPGALAAGVVAIADWLSGQLADGLSALGGSLRPASAGAFRSAGIAGGSEQTLAVLTIPLGLADDGRLLSGSDADDCLERFQLLLQATGSKAPEELVVQLAGELRGDLLPDGLSLIARRGGRQQVITTSGSSTAELRFQGGDGLIEITLSHGDAPPLVLPPLALPRP